MINLILSHSNRSLVYLEYIVRHFNKNNFDIIIFYGVEKELLFKNTINKLGLTNKIIFFKSKNINKIKIKDSMINKKNFNIISSYPGEIVRNEVLLSKELIHCHPGNLPKFRGSTTIYYSIILTKEVCVTIIQLNKKIDEGKVLYKKKFKIPKDKFTIEKNYDNIIRAKTLINYLKLKVRKKSKSQKKNSHLPYFVAHPIIRQIVLDKKLLKYLNQS